MYVRTSTIVNLWIEYANVALLNWALLILTGPHYHTVCMLITAADHQCLFSLFYNQQP